MSTHSLCMVPVFASMRPWVLSGSLNMQVTSWVGVIIQEWRKVAHGHAADALRVCGAALPFCALIRLLDDLYIGPGVKQ